MKRGRRFWNATWRKRYATAALLLGHLFWVSLARHTYSTWDRASIWFFRGILAVSAKWENWSYERSQKLKNIEAAQEEIDLLRSELRALRLERQKEGAKLLEADEIIHVLGLRELLHAETQTARIIANSRKARFGGIIIDLGEEHHIEQDQGVICAEGVVGRIWAVGKSQSIILPLDAQNSSTAVMLGGSRATGILQGIGPGLATIRYISSQEVVQLGEPVYTSALDNVFPKGMLIGYVLGASPRDLEMDITVALAAPLDRLGLLFVLPFANHLEFSTDLRQPVHERGEK